MPILNFEFKASAKNLQHAEEKLLMLKPYFAGTDHQKDTYFNTATGRLKLREGNIENALIYYERENVKGAKQSKVILYKHPPNADLKSILTKTNGVKVVVDKIRKIYFVLNIKVHFDIVDGLGTFIEVEAIDKDGTIGVEKLKQQCNELIELFSISENDFIEKSYSDLLLAKHQ